VPDRIPFIDLEAANAELGDDLKEAVCRVVDSGWYLLGPELEAFEDEFARYCGVRHCIGVSSGLSALELSLEAAGIGPGDEVIVPGFTWVATWIAVTKAGAKPVPVDADPRTWNIDADQVGAAVTPRTVAIVPVHLRGEPADVAAIAEVADEHGLAVIEDAAQAHGARHHDRRVGGLGKAAAFSFYPTKNLGALGDAGAVTTDDDELAERVRLLRNYGTRSRYEIETAGVNSRLAEIHAAVLRLKLARLDGWNARRVELAAAYRAQLADHPSLELPEPPEWAEPVWHLFAIGHPERDRCREALADEGIQTLVHYPIPPHLSKAYPDYERLRGALPVTERICEQTLSLPMYPQLSGDACARVAEAVLQTV
jgi:dTDP-3-amino-3,4,6-trideoxy-alpha-D-glucose transaminase